MRTGSPGTVGEKMMDESGTGKQKWPREAFPLPICSGRTSARQTKHRPRCGISRVPVWTPQPGLQKDLPPHAAGTGREARRPRWLLLKRSRTVPGCRHRGPAGAGVPGESGPRCPPPTVAASRGDAPARANSRLFLGRERNSWPAGPLGGVQHTSLPCSPGEQSRCSGKGPPSAPAGLAEVGVPPLAPPLALPTALLAFGSIFQAQTESQVGRGRTLSRKGKRPCPSVHPRSHPPLAFPTPTRFDQWPPCLGHGGG